MIKAVLTGGERVEVHKCVRAVGAGGKEWWEEREKGDRLILFHLLPSVPLSFLLCLSVHLSLSICFSWLSQSACSSHCGTQLELRTKAHCKCSRQLPLQTPRGTAVLPQWGVKWISSTLHVRLMTGNKAEQRDLLLETDLKVTGESSGQNKWLSHVNEYTNACPDMFISHPHAHCEEAMFVSLQMGHLYFNILGLH